MQSDIMFTENLFSDSLKLVPGIGLFVAFWGALLTVFLSFSNISWSIIFYSALNTFITGLCIGLLVVFMTILLQIVFPSDSLIETDSNTLKLVSFFTFILYILIFIISIYVIYIVITTTIQSQGTFIWTWF